MRTGVDILEFSTNQVLRRLPAPVPETVSMGIYHLLTSRNDVHMTFFGPSGWQPILTSALRSPSVLGIPVPYT